MFSGEGCTVHGDRRCVTPHASMPNFHRAMKQPEGSTTVTAAVRTPAGLRCAPARDAGLAPAFRALLVLASQ